MTIAQICDKKTLSKLINALKDEFKLEDGLSDSIKTCLFNFCNRTYRDMLDDLTKPDFIREDKIGAWLKCLIKIILTIYY